MSDNYIETMALRTCDCDMHGDWRPGAILEAMQETATAHCARLGLDRAATDALGVAWVLLDVNARRITDSDAVKSRLPENAGRPAGPRMSAALRPLAAEPVRGDFMPPYSDFDVNGHANNTRYLDWCCSALGFGTMAEAQLTDFEISYDSEVRPGAELHAELAREGDRFTYCGFDGGKRCFCVAGTLTPRGK